VKVEGYLFLGCALFFGASDIVYWYFSKDPTGTTALALAVLLAALIGYYTLFTGRRLPERPHDWSQPELLRTRALRHSRRDRIGRLEADCL